MIFLVLALYVFFALYVLTVSLYGVHLRGKLNWAGYLFGWPWVLVAYIVDIFFQYTVFTVLYWEIPPRGEWTVSRRLSRWKRNDPLSRRGTWSRKLCSFLSVFDPKGDHC
jgi:hypothetical protein